MPDDFLLSVPPHGGNRQERAEVLGCRPGQLLDLSASLVPFGPPPWLRAALRRAMADQLVPYPDRRYASLSIAIAGHHKIDPDWVLPGNGAAELFTWAARDSAAFHSLLPQPGFNDYIRALNCWHGPWDSIPLRLTWPASFPQPFTAALANPLIADQTKALWITNPHNPSGQLWSAQSIEPLLSQFGFVVVDEAFLPLVPGGEQQSLVGLIDRYSNLVVVRSLTKLFAVAGLRLGYAIARPDRLARWAAWRDPWPINGLAAAVGGQLLVDQNWQNKVQRWVAKEGPWLAKQLQQFEGITPMPSAANFLLINSLKSLEPFRLKIEQQHRILLRDCRSFRGLNENYLRVALSDRAGNRRLIKALVAVANN